MGLKCRFFWLGVGGAFGIHFLFFSTNQCWRRSRDWERWHWHLIPQGPKSILCLRGQACFRKRPSGISNKREVKEVINNHKKKKKKTRQNNEKPPSHNVSPLTFSWKCTLFSGRRVKRSPLKLHSYIVDIKILTLILQPSTGCASAMYTRTKSAISQKSPTICLNSGNSPT